MNIYAKTAILVNTRTEQGVDVEEDKVREEESLNAYVANQKIHMKWNGKVYVGNAHGMEFTTAGPKILHNIRGR